MGRTDCHFFKKSLLVIILAISSFFLALYLQFEPRTVVGIALFIGSLLATKYLYNLKIKPKKSELISFHLFWDITSLFREIPMRDW